MDNLILEAQVHISFEYTFPCTGEIREIKKADKSEWLNQVLDVSNLEWKIENRKVVGADGDMKYRFIEKYGHLQKVN